MTTRSDRRRPTMREVAVVAGVSTATVSRVINGGHWVSPEANQAVMEAIRKTGYTANQVAQSLATGRTNALAFLLTEDHQLLFSDPTFSRLVRHAAAALTKRSMNLVLLVAGTDAEREHVLRYVTSGHVDGVMLISHHEADSLLDSLLQSGVATVSCGIPLGHHRPVSSVAVDEAGSARTMTRYLLGAGHRRIAMVAGPQDTAGGRFRLAGFRRTMADLYDPSLVVEGDFSLASGEEGMTRLLAAGPPPDAVFAASDTMAAGVIRALRSAGLSVPGDVAVAGFDDSGLAAEHDPPLTTMRQPWAQIGEHLVGLVLESGRGKEVRTVDLPASLIVRESA